VPLIGLAIPPLHLPAQRQPLPNPAQERLHFSGGEGAFGRKAITKAIIAAKTRTKTKPPPACK
jgi:hypothetical protein